MAKKKVYLIRAAQFYKIGISSNIDNRLKQIQTGCPIKCEYVGYIPCNSADRKERELHDLFKEFKTHGEWFDLGDDNIERLIVDHNLKWVINPYEIVSEHSEKATRSNDLKDVRSVSDLLNKMDVIYHHYYSDKIPEDGRHGLLKVIDKYGHEVSLECFKFLCKKWSNPQKCLQYMWSTCKNYDLHERHVPEQAWQLFWKVNEARGKADAVILLQLLMHHHVDEDEIVHNYIVRHMYDFRLDIEDVFESYFMNPIEEVDNGQAIY